MVQSALTVDRDIQGTSAEDMKRSLSPRSNMLLAKLSDNTLRDLWPHLHLAYYPSGVVLCTHGEPHKHMYFPTSGVVGRVVSTSREEAVVALVGSEGMVGVSLLSGGSPKAGALSTAKVLMGAWAYKCTASIAEKHLFLPDILPLFLRYGQCVLSEAMQAAICHRYHRIEQKLCRWLLMCADRVGSTTLDTTHCVISQALGVRRERVTECAGALQQAGVVKLARGAVHLLDRNVLLERTCDCYHITTTRYRTLVANYRLAYV